MTPLTRPLRWLVTGFVMMTIVACADSHQNNANNESPDSVNTVRYTVRGRIQALPDENKPTSQFLVHHEPVPSFMREGTVVGMKSMTMPFPVAKSLSLDGFFVDDIIELTFEIQLDPETSRTLQYEAISVTRLSPETALVFDSPLQSQQAQPNPTLEPDQGQ